MKIANKICPITLEKIDDSCFVFQTNSGIGRAYHKKAFEKYMRTASNFVDPVSREPLKSTDIEPVFPKFHQKYTNLMSRLFVDALFEELAKQNYASCFVNRSINLCSPEIFDIEITCLRFCIGMIFMCSKPKFRSVCKKIQNNIKKYKFSKKIIQKALKYFQEIKKETQKNYSLRFLKFTYVGNQITPEIVQMNEIN